MRISDWSSDVCSSDLFPGSLYALETKASFTKPTWRAILSVEPEAGKRFYLSYDRGYKSGTYTSQAQNAAQAAFLVKPERLDSFNLGAKTSWLDNKFRSEEHTSELQSLMRISYAVFCLKKKKKHKKTLYNKYTHTHTNKS